MEGFEWKTHKVIRIQKKCCHDQIKIEAASSESEGTGN